MVAMTPLRLWAPAITPFWTSMTSSAVFGRSGRVVMGTSDDKSIREPRGGGVTFARMRAPRAHTYEISVRWTGNRGTGTSNFRSYDRAHDVAAGRGAAVEG